MIKPIYEILHISYWNVCLTLHSTLNPPGYYHVPVIINILQVDLANSWQIESRALSGLVPHLFSAGTTSFLSWYYLSFGRVYLFWAGTTSLLSWYHISYGMWHIFWAGNTSLLGWYISSELVHLFWAGTTSFLSWYHLSSGMVHLFWAGSTSFLSWYHLSSGLVPPLFWSRKGLLQTLWQETGEAKTVTILETVAPQTAKTLLLHLFLIILIMK